jgi:flagellar biosynthesis protein FlhA
LLQGLERRQGGGQPAIDPAEAQRLVKAIGREGEAMAAAGQMPLVVCSPPLRPIIRRLSRHAFPRLVVLSYAELEPRLQIEPVGVIRT